MPNSTQETQHTYDQLVASYHSANADRESMRIALERFVEFLDADSSVLDVGCGPGFDSAELPNNVTSLDYSFGMLNLAQTQYGCRVVQADMRHLPFPNSVFDGLWVSASFLHIPPADSAATLRGFNRILRMGGLIMLTVKEGTGEKIKLDRYGHSLPRYFNYWKPTALDSLLQTSGFKIMWRHQNSTPKDTWLWRIARKKG